MGELFRKELSGIFGGILVILLFLLLTYLLQANMEFFERLIVNDYLGVVIYYLLLICALVFAPITALPLLPVATSLWGEFLSFLITSLGLISGSVIVFLISRKFGKPLIERFIFLDSISPFEEKVHMTNGFWGVLFLRMFIPIDLVNYSIGLFSKVKLIPYTLATVLWVLPVVFLLVKLGEIKLIYQADIFLLFLNIFLAVLIFKKIRF